MEGLWKGGKDVPRFDALLGDTKTDALIIGGGIAGILCAYMLKRAGVDCILVEADRILGGITKGTTAKITYQHGLIYSKLIRTVGEYKAQLYLEAQRDALLEYIRICDGKGCRLEQKPSFVYSLTDRQKIEDEVEAIIRLGGDADFCETVALPFEVVGAVRVDGQAQFDPLAFLYEISKGLPIYEKTKVTELKDGYAVTDKGCIRAQSIIVATHFPFINKHGFYFLKMYQHRSYVLALKGAGDVGGMYIDEAKGGMSFRNSKDLLLLGGGGHRTGQKGGCWQALERFAERYYPGAEVVARTSTQDCMTLDGMPYIGRYSSSTNDLYVTTGFNKWGMTSAMAGAKLLSSLILQQRNEYEELFSPSRNVIHPQLALNAAHALLGLVTPSLRRCPHLGCALKYNAAEHSWDCPCHGSRFGKDGELIDNPATGDASL